MAKVLVSVPDQLLSQIDEVAEAECRTRSELLREGFRLSGKVVTAAFMLTFLNLFISGSKLAGL